MRKKNSSEKKQINGFSLFLRRLNIIRIQKFIHKKPLNIFYSIKKASFDDKKTFKESFLGLLSATLGGLIAGFFLEMLSDDLKYSLPGILILIPGAIAMRGNIFASMGSRLGSAIHTGELSPPFIKNKSLKEAIMLTAWQTLILSFYLGVLTYIMASLMGMHDKMSIVEYVVISVAGGFIAGIIILITALAMIQRAYKSDWDVDNVSAPMITTMGDIFTVPVILLTGLFLITIDEILLNAIFYCIVLLLIIHLVNIVKKKPGISRKITEDLIESLPVMALCGIFSIFTGTVLQGNLDMIITFSMILFIVPAINDSAGNTGSIFASRLSSAFHIGDIEINIMPERQSIRIIKTLILTGFFVYNILFIVTISFAMAFSIPVFSSFALFFIILASGIISSLLGIIISYYLTYLSIKRGFDPDNVVIPILTSVMDLFGTICVILMLLLFI